MPKERIVPVVKKWPFSTKQVERFVAEWMSHRVSKNGKFRFYHSNGKRSFGHGSDGKPLAIWQDDHLALDRNELRFLVETPPSEYWRFLNPNFYSEDATSRRESFTRIYCKNALEAGAFINWMEERYILDRETDQGFTERALLWSKDSCGKIDPVRDVLSRRSKKSGRDVDSRNAIARALQRLREKGA